MRNSFDRELEGLVLDRHRLLKDLGPVLRRAGPDHPRRAQANKARATKRKALRRALRLNAEAIAARTMFLYDVPPEFDFTLSSSATGTQ